MLEYVPPSARHLEFALYALDRVGAAKPGSLAAPLLTLTERLARRGIVIVISDLYDDPERVAQAVRPLRFRGHDVTVFHVLDPAEIDFPFDEAASFEDLESGDRMPIVPEALRDCSTAPSSGRTSPNSAACSPTAGSTTRSSTRRCRSITPSSTTSPRASA